jgi:small GTP-binding protein
MGGFFTSTWKKLFQSEKKVRILMVGLDAVGKTTIMYKLKMNETVKTIPTVGFNVESMNYKTLSMTMWDIGGQDKIRALWKYYYSGTDAVIFVVDSSDTDRLEESAEELHKMLQDEELSDACVLVYANKQDLSGSLAPNDVSAKMKLGDLRGRKWMVQGTSAVNGTGLTEGLDWLAQTLGDSK